MDYVGKEHVGLNGKYKVTKHVASGGMGHVYEATAFKTGNQVIVKLPTTHMPDGTPMSINYHATIIEKLRVESEVLKNLTSSGSPNIVNYIDESADPNNFFLVIEKISGKPVTRLVTSSGLPERQVIGMSLDVLQGLSFLHERNTIYRDMKPDNIMVMNDGHCMMIDFGAAKQGFTQMRGNDEGNATGLHSPGWTCPDQNAGKASPECDLYALGRVMFYMGTGFRPDRFTNATGQMKKKMHEIRPTISASLSHLVDRLIDPDHNTIHTAADLIDRLQQMQQQMSQMQQQPQQLLAQSPQVQQKWSASKSVGHAAFIEPRIVMQGVEYRISNLVGGTLIGKQHNETDCQKSGGICNAYRQGRNIFVGWACPSKCRCSYNPAHMVDKHHMRVWRDDSGQICVVNNDPTRRSAINRSGIWRSMTYQKKEVLKNHDQVALLYNEKKGPYLSFIFYGR